MTDRWTAARAADREPFRPTPGLAAFVLLAVSALVALADALDRLPRWNALGLLVLALLLTAAAWFVWTGSEVLGGLVGLVAGVALLLETGADAAPLLALVASVGILALHARNGTIVPPRLHDAAAAPAPPSPPPSPPPPPPSATDRERAAP